MLPDLTGAQFLSFPWVPPNSEAEQAQPRPCAALQSGTLAMQLQPLGDRDGHLVAGSRTQRGYAGEPSSLGQLVRPPETWAARSWGLRAQPRTLPPSLRVLEPAPPMASSLTSTKSFMAMSSLSRYMMKVPRKGTAPCAMRWWWW